METVENHPSTNHPSTDGVNSAVVEVLNRSGQVLQRVRYNGGELRIGRAYDNDVIVGDPYVCPHHLVLRTSRGQLILEDLGSVNGTWSGKRQSRMEITPVNPGQLVQFGHSQLRLQSPNAGMEPAWKDIVRHGVLNHLHRPWLWFLAAVLCIASLGLDKVIDSAKSIGIGVLASGLVYPLLGVMLWSGVWSMINRLIAHRANFRIHFSIAALGVSAIFLNAQLVPLLGFGVGWTSAVGWLKFGGQVAILGLALFAHMQFATHGRSWIQALGSGLLAVTLIGAPIFGELLRSEEFSSLPRLDPLLKPPYVKQVEGESVSAFFERSSKLQAALDKASDD